MTKLSATIVATAAAVLPWPTASLLAPIVPRNKASTLLLGSRHGSWYGITPSPPSALFYAVGDDGDASDPADLAVAPPLPVHPRAALPSDFLARMGTDDWKEWQYSFGRNGLTDFLPQFSSHISCLAIDLETATAAREGGVSGAISGSSSRGGARLPWQEQREDDDDSTPQASTTTTTSVTHVVASSSSSSSSSSSLAPGDHYDCILDSGVMNAVVSSIPSTVTWHSRTGPTAVVDLVRLMNEASKSIREFGIYVAITDESIPDHARGYLDAMGEVLGMEWNYDLDGLTTGGEGGYSVSVARKFYAGAVNYEHPPASSSGLGDDYGNLLGP